MADMIDDLKRGDIEPTLVEPRDKLSAAERLRWDARATHRAMAGWQLVRTEEDWVRITAAAHEEYASGAFLLERLGAERYLDPTLMATLLALRHKLLTEWRITTASETMLVDLVLLSYAHVFRVQGWIGDLAVRIEHEFFGDHAFTDRVNQGVTTADRLAVVDRVRRLSEQLMPLWDRANRMMIRNLKAIKELRQGQVPAIAIDRAEQVTVTSRPPRGLRPVKTEWPQPDVPPDVFMSVPNARSGGDGVAAVPSAKRRPRSVGRSRQTPRRRPGSRARDTHATQDKSRTRAGARSGRRRLR
jgi:hypothetical protein